MGDAEAGAELVELALHYDKRGRTRRRVKDDDHIPPGFEAAARKRCTRLPLEAIAHHSSFEAMFGPQTHPRLVAACGERPDGHPLPARPPSSTVHGAECHGGFEARGEGRVNSG